MTNSSLASASRMPDGASLQLQPKRELPGFTANLESKQILAQLRASIAVGGGDLDAMLQRIVNAAQLLTDANGAAIALEHDNWIVCRARAGEMAPDSGSRLDRSSGISGECLRSGKALCCDDAWADSRVDAEACRRLGLRSLAAVPIGEGPNAHGILEAFSAQPHAFGETEVSLLQELAGLVSVVQQGGKPTVLRKRIGEKFSSMTPSFSKHKFIVAGVVAIAFVVWLGVRKRLERPNVAAAEAAQPLTVQSSPTDVDFSSPMSTPGGLSRTRSNMETKPPAGIVMASKIAKLAPSEDVSAQPLLEVASDSGRSPLSLPAPHSSSPRSPDESAPIPPSIAVVSGISDQGIAGVLSESSPVVPQASITRSQGFSGGRLEEKVNPIYPPVALVERRQGPVILNGVVAEDGRLRDLKVINGDPVLAHAAMQAVSQWRYEPYKLNGEPIKMTTTITLIFKLP